MGAKQLAMTAAYALVRLVRSLTHARAPSVQTLVFTPAGKLVLVQHSYVAGWCFPGGGIKRGETPEAAVVRELREEIGLTGWVRITRLQPWLAISDGGLFLVEGAEYCFRPSLEIDAIAEFDLDTLPESRPLNQKRALASWMAMRNGTSEAPSA